MNIYELILAFVAWFVGIAAYNYWREHHNDGLK